MMLANTAFLTILTLIYTTHSQSLTPFSNCNDMVSYYKQQALLRVGPFGIPRLQFASVPPSTPFTQDETQENKADIMKTDPSQKRMYILQGSTLYMIRMERKGASGKVCASVKLESYSNKMHVLEQGVVLVYGSVFGRLKAGKGGDEGGSFDYYPHLQSVTVVYRIEVVGDDSIRVVEKLRLEGSLTRVDIVENGVRMVMRWNVASGIQFEYAGGNLTEREAMSRNRRIINESRGAQWMPGYHWKGNTENEEEGLYLTKCENVYATRETFTGFELTSVLTLEPNSKNLQPKHTLSIGGSGNGITVPTSDKLYVTDMPYRNDYIGREGEKQSGTDFQTWIHQFNLDAKRPPVHTASGTVAGSLIPGDGLHPVDNTTVYAGVTPGAPWWAHRDTTVYTICVMRESTTTGGKLETVGKIRRASGAHRVDQIGYIGYKAYILTHKPRPKIHVIDLTTNTHTPHPNKTLRIPSETTQPPFLYHIPPDPHTLLLVSGQTVTLHTATQTASWTVPKLQQSRTEVEWQHGAGIIILPGASGVAVLAATVYGRRGPVFVGNVLLQICVQGEAGVSQVGMVSQVGGRPVVRNVLVGRLFVWALSYGQVDIYTVRQNGGNKVVGKIGLRMGA